MRRETNRCSGGVRRGWVASTEFSAARRIGRKTEALQLWSHRQPPPRIVTVDHCLSPHLHFFRTQHQASHFLAKAAFIHILRHRSVCIRFALCRNPHLQSPRQCEPSKSRRCGDLVRGRCRNPVCVCQDCTLDEPVTDPQPGRTVGNTRYLRTPYPGSLKASLNTLGEGFRTRKRANCFCPTITLHDKSTLPSLALASLGAREIPKCSRTKIFLTREELRHL